MKQGKISVIIPMFNAGKFLDSLVLSLKKQSDDNFEVIFVDNNSMDNTSEKISSLIHSDDRFRVIKYKNKASSYGARNYGVRFSNGNILVFTDADCLPENDWLYSIRSCINNNLLISGHVDLDLINRFNIWEVFDKVAHMKNKDKASKGHVATANMAVMREDFFRIGIFSEVTSGGDYEWSTRAVSSGLNLIFNNEVIVKHPTRKTKREIREKLMRIAKGQSELKRDNKAAFLLYMLRTINPIRTLKYTLSVMKYSGVVKSAFFFVEFNCLCFEQIKVFRRGLSK